MSLIAKENHAALPATAYACLRRAGLPLLVLVFCAGFYVAQRWKLPDSGVITSIQAFAGLILAGTKPKD